MRTLDQRRQLFVSMSVVTRTRPEAKTLPYGRRLATQEWGSNVGLITLAAAIAPALVAIESSLFGPDAVTLAVAYVIQIVAGMGAALIGRCFGLSDRVAVLVAADFLLALTLGRGLLSLVP